MTARSGPVGLIRSRGPHLATFDARGPRAVVSRAAVRRSPTLTFRATTVSLLRSYCLIRGDHAVGL